LKTVWSYIIFKRKTKRKVFVLIRLNGRYLHPLSFPVTEACRLAVQCVNIY